MNDTKIKIREKIKLFVKELKAQEFPISTISEELNVFVTSSLENYLSGKNSSLDAAFDLGPKEGNPGNPKKRLDIARIAVPLRIKNISWKRVVDEVNITYLGEDERTVRRYCDEYINQVWAEVLTKKLEENDYHKEGKKDPK